MTKENLKLEVADLDSKLDKVSIKNPSEAFVGQPGSSELQARMIEDKENLRPKEVTFGKEPKSVQFSDALDDMKDIFNE